MNGRHICAAIVGALGIILTGTEARAALVTFDLENVTFNEGGTASGSFVFNTSTGTYTSWSITTTATTEPSLNGYVSLAGASYTTNAYSSATIYNVDNPRAFGVQEGPGADSFELLFKTALTAAGGTIQLGGNSGDGGESENYGFTSRVVETGSVVSVPAVPLPAALPMFGTAAAGLIGFAMRRKASKTL